MDLLEGGGGVFWFLLVVVEVVEVGVGRGAGEKSGCRGIEEVRVATRSLLGRKVLFGRF